MIKVYFCDVTNVNKANFEALLGLLPSFLQSEVLAVRNDVDRKARLIARIMLLNSLQQTGEDYLLHSQKKNSHGKPFIEGWDFFNISHSGDYVVMAHGSTPLGIDIEKVKDIDVAAIDYLLHAEERNHIAQAVNKTEAFYDIWVKKESFLKATGQGLTGDFADFNTAAKSIQLASDNWYFHHLNIAPDYECYLCTPSVGVAYKILEFEQQMWSNLLR